MIEGDARKSKPYRVEWRPNLVTGWSLMGLADEHERALGDADASIEKYGCGQARVLSQHVIHVSGLDA